ncbi:MAG: hypothetical protein JJU00_06630 [Opitutales bacterium]|nr:hypothetical protein [Opitutales bacterium]
MVISLEKERRREVFAGLRRRFGADVARMEREALRTGAAGLDAALRGGWRRGECHEVVEGRAGAGGTLVLELCLEAARRERGFAALVDGADGFAPEAVDAAVLPHLFWVRCGGETAAALRAAELLARDANFLFLLLDLRGHAAAELRRIPAGGWYGLQRAAKRSGQALVVFAEVSCVAAASVRLALEERYGAEALEAERAELTAALRPERELRRASGGGADPCVLQG